MFLDQYARKHQRDRNNAYSTETPSLFSSRRGDKSTEF